MSPSIVTAYGSGSNVKKGAILFTLSSCCLLIAILAVALLLDFKIYCKLYHYHKLIIIGGGLGKNRTYDTYLFRVLLYY